MDNDGQMMDRLIPLKKNCQQTEKTGQDRSIDHSWTGMNWSSWVWPRLLTFGISLGPVSVSVNPNLGEKTGPDWTFKC